MKKVSPINRALRPAADNARRPAPSTDVAGGRLLNAVPTQNRTLHTARDADQSLAGEGSARESIRGLFNEYQSREQEQHYQHLEQKVADAVSELNARISSQEQQIRGLQNTLESERRLSQSAVANLKDLFDGNYQVMSEITERYEDRQHAFDDEKASFDRRLEFIQQESHESTNQLRAAIIQSQDEDRVNLAQSLRALADSIDRERKT